MPISSPLITVLTTPPCSPSGAISAAKGTSTCAATVVSPTTPAATTRTGRFGAAAVAASPSTVTASMTNTSRRRSSRSPSGTRVASPSA